MRAFSKIPLVVVLAVAVATAWPPTVAHPAQERTYFEVLPRAWAVGTIGVSGPLSFSGGKVLGFPGRIHELVHARVGRPASILLVWEVESEGDEPPFNTDDVFFAPIGVLPQHAYWRANLPRTPRHEILGGRRNLFTGDEVEPAMRISKAYVATLELAREPRWLAQNAVFADALLAGVATLREDASLRLAKLLPLTKVVDDEARGRLGEFIAGDDPIEQRVRVIGAVGGAGLTDLVPVLEKLAANDDRAAVASMEALDRLGKPRTTSRLVELSTAGHVGAREYAYLQLGLRAADDEDAYMAVRRVLEADADAAVRSAAAGGLGRSGSARAVAPLRKALYRGDGASRAAASALADVGGSEAFTVLKGAVTDAPADGQVAAVLAIVEAEDDCDDCRAFLREQYDGHEEKAVRDLIEVLLEIAPDAGH